MPPTKGFPTVKYCKRALSFDELFGDLIKKTGKTALEYIQDKIVGIAKVQLLIPLIQSSRVAYQLGFQYPQHFTRVFKKATE